MGAEKQVRDSVDRGTGVFNGDTGIIRDINTFSELVTVEFDEGKMVEYSFKQLERAGAGLRHHHS